VRREIILSGEGGQGLILAGAILAEAAGVYEDKEVVQTQSYGIQARGGASRSTLIISESRIKFPEVLRPDTLLCLSQEAYERYVSSLRSGGLLIVDADLVNIEGVRSDIQVMAFSFTGEAEKLGRRVAANLVALGALAVVAGLVRPESLARAIPARLPERSLPAALVALEAGIRLGQAVAGGSQHE
jgi:2-oxoglutarate ferredoxin oxidoreductase subunit gamma